MILRMLERSIIKGFEGLDHLFREKNDCQGELDSEIGLGFTAHPFHPDIFEKAILNDEARLKHLYILGSTGSGKTKLIEFMLRQQISKQNGFGLIDPHGDLTRNILSFLTRRFRESELDELGQRFILIEPFNRNWAIGFNPLQAMDGHFPAMLELLEIFKRFWGNSYWGPRMDELLRNALVTLSQNNLTLLETRPLLTDEGFRQRLLENVSYREVRDYWLYRYNPLSDRMQSLYRESVLNKVSSFVADPSIYRILGQSESTINLREAMDQGKWILLNLSKGQLKENIRLLGTLFLAKIKQAALSRVDTPEEHRRSFYVFVDEFQNFIGNDFEEILSEARKYRLGLTIAHQNLDQVPKELRSVILSNVGTEVFFRVSHHDAAQISSEMDQKEKNLIERKLVDLGPREAFLKLKGQRPRILKTSFVSPDEAPDEAIERIKKASFQNWARPVNEVESEIEERRTLWAIDEAVKRVPRREQKITALRDYSAFSPEGLFEEGQSEW